MRISSISMTRMLEFVLLYIRIYISTYLRIYIRTYLRIYIRTYLRITYSKRRQGNGRKRWNPCLSLWVCMREGTGAVDTRWLCGGPEISCVPTSGAFVRSECHAVCMSKSSGCAIERLARRKCSVFVIVSI